MAVKEANKTAKEEVTEKGKYEAMVIGDKKGKDKKPLIASGKGYEITLLK